VGQKGGSDRFLRAFGQAVRAVREGRGLSQEDLGFEAELDRTYISGIERGVRNPTLRTVLRLAEALEVRPSKLVRDAEGE
jgi:transcriptional regulator with XRE-family HTH domain